MNEGKIIKFYRVKANLTQEQLGKGICSVTHMSNIEKGVKYYSPEIVSLLSKRLEINLEEEVYNLKTFEKQLYRWHNSIIMEQEEEIETIKDALENNPVLHISDYSTLYQLLQARYFLIHGKIMKAYKIIKTINRTPMELPKYEQNLLKHILGIYYLSEQEHLKAIHILKTINDDDYKNPEYYYHLALAYHSIESKVMAYHYAEKSLQYFKEKNHSLKIIDARMIMLAQIDNDENQHNFSKIIEQYEGLIQSSNLCKSPDKKAKILHNFAYEHFRRGHYKEARKLYKDSMDLKEKNTVVYLLSLDGYLRSCQEGCLLSKEELLSIAHEGLYIANKLNDPLFVILFNNSTFLLENDESKWHNYLSEKALPYLKTKGYFYLVERFEKDLFYYYSKTNQNDKTLEMAHALIKKQ
jgi:HTH-type transcriptional regulator, quorum sensing regulator NprR